jgi:hypothetical protein
VTLAVVALAIACAIRGLWSPCGLSMLSTITPLGERSRGHSYAWSLSWYLLGATLGGACLGACLCGGAALLGVIGPHQDAVAIVVALVVLVCLAGDARLGGFRLPEHPRQVNERWLDRFRPWAYASGFGWQIGTGFATYVMTDAIYALAIVSICALPPVSAFAVGTLFGLVRGACLLVGASVSAPDSLRALHERMARLAPWSIAAPTVAQIAILLCAGVWTRQPAVFAACALAGVGLGVAVLRRARATATLRLAAP